uniref:Transcriptional regulator, AsnC family n=1 Tax=Caulobacter sp. (strain K31) TaxID=366602 RepID=B0SX95_CAUSK
MIAVQTTGLGFFGALADRAATSVSRAHLMLEVAPRDAAAVEARLAAMVELTALHEITGDFDLVAVIEAGRPEDLERAIERIRGLEGVRRAESSLLLARKPGEGNLRGDAGE